MGDGLLPGLQFVVVVFLHFLGNLATFLEFLHVFYIGLCLGIQLTFQHLYSFIGLFQVPLQPTNWLPAILCSTATLETTLSLTFSSLHHQELNLFLVDSLLFLVQCPHLCYRILHVIHFLPQLSYTTLCLLFLSRHTHELPLQLLQLLLSLISSFFPLPHRMPPDLLPYCLLLFQVHIFLFHFVQLSDQYFILHSQPLDFSIVALYICLY